MWKALLTDTSQGWTADNWLTLAAVIVAGIAVLGALYGVWLGAQLNQAATDRQQARKDLQLALAKAERALDDIRIEDLSDMMWLDNNDVTKLAANLTSLQRKERLDPALDALLAVHVQHPKEQVRANAESLSTALRWSYIYTIKWYEEKFDSLKSTKGDKDNQNQLNELRKRAASDQARVSQLLLQLQGALDSSTLFRPRYFPLWRRRNES